MTLCESSVLQASAGAPGASGAPRGQETMGPESRPLGSSAASPAATDVVATAVPDQVSDARPPGAAPAAVSQAGMPVEVAPVPAHDDVSAPAGKATVAAAAPASAGQARSVSTTGTRDAAEAKDSAVPAQAPSASAPAAGACDTYASGSTSPRTQRNEGADAYHRTPSTSSE